jgi:hypothetical protein
MTHNHKSKSKSKGKGKAKPRDLELDKEFKEKYPEFNRICTLGKNLILEHFQAGPIFSKYYDDDIVRTIDALDETLKTDQHIAVEFYHDRGEDFVRDIGRILSRTLLQEAQQPQDDEERQEKEDQQHKLTLTKEIEALKLLHPDLTLDEWLSTLQQKHKVLQDTVKKYMPDIWIGIDYVLSILRILNLHDCTQPFIGLLLGRPGSGKTVILSLFRDWVYAYFKDRFTPKAFVTHTTAVESKEELEEIDMLPLMKDNIFLTPELSTTFSKKEDELVEIIGIITRLADGQGLSDHSGAHGGREYRDIMFTWAAAAVDIPDKVYKILSTLGPKWYNLRLPFREKTEDELVKEAIDSVDFSTKERTIKEALFDYLKWFELAPHSIKTENENETETESLPLPFTKVKIQWDKEHDEYQAHIFIVKVAMLLTHLRCSVMTWKSYTDHEDMDYKAAICEDPSRTRQLLYNLARGHALSRGYTHISVEDVSIVIKTVLSTADLDRIAVFTLLISMKDGKLTTNQIMTFLNKSKHYALKTMIELKAIGLADMDDVQATVWVKKQTGEEYSITTTTRQITLKEAFKWFMSEEFDRLREGFVATDNRAYMNIKEKEKSQEDISSDTTRAENREGILEKYFWAIYGDLEAQDGNGKVIVHNDLHEALVSSGKFYGGDATQIIEDMVKAGRLQEVSFQNYRRVE